MSVCIRTIRQVRVDIPLRSTYAYLFVDANQSAWDPWWGKLHEHLLNLVPPQLEWKYEPVQGVYVARPKLTDQQRAELASFFRSAPEQEIREHRTLRRAAELTLKEYGRLELMYFSEDAGAEEPAP